MVTISDPYVLSGHVYDINEVALESAKVTAVNLRTGESVEDTTNAQGEYIMDLANLKTAYADKDIIYMQAISVLGDILKFAEHRFEVKITDGVHERELYLSATTPRAFANTTSRSELVLANSEHDDSNQAKRTITVEKTYTQRLSYGTNNMIKYQGWAKPGTSAGEPGWRIRKLSYTGNYTIRIEWADGNDKFDKIWNDRNSYTFS